MCYNVILLPTKHFSFNNYYFAISIIETTTSFIKITCKNPLKQINKIKSFIKFDNDSIN